MSPPDCFRGDRHVQSANSLFDLERAYPMPQDMTDVGSIPIEALQLVRQPLVYTNVVYTIDGTLDSLLSYVVFLLTFYRS